MLVEDVDEATGVRREGATSCSESAVLPRERLGVERACSSASRGEWMLASASRSGSCRRTRARWTRAAVWSVSHARALCRHVMAAPVR